MKFYLRRGATCEALPNIDREVIEDEVLELEDHTENALMLEPETPINQCDFIQAYYPEPEYDDGKGYSVLVSLLNADGNSNRLYIYETLDVREVINIFLDYFEKQQRPDVTTWRDMTDELK